MKILVVSLLRLGDVILSTPTLRGLREKYPDAQLDILINGQFKNLSPLIPFANNVYSFDRKIVQDSLCSPQRSLFEGYDSLKDLIQNVNNNDYDLVVNLTHNRFSAWLTGLINSKRKLGLHFLPNGKPQFGNLWFKYLNDYASEISGDHFHYIDIFSSGAGISAQSRHVTLNTSAHGETTAIEILQKKKNSKFILVQALTSEEKKNYGLERLADAIKTFQYFHPKHTFLMLCSDSEKSLIDSLTSSLRESGVDAETVACDLETAYSLLLRASLLVTGDTSIKHLASATNVPILEISIGSSDFRKTGAYLPGSIIVQSKEACAPCPHRFPCSQASHKCAEGLPSELIALLMSKILTKQESDLRILAHEYSDVADILKADLTEDGYWTAWSYNESFDRTKVEHYLDRSSWKIFLNKSYEKKSNVYEEEGQRLKLLLSRIFPEQSSFDWKSAITDIEMCSGAKEKRAQFLIEKIREIVSKQEKNQWQNIDEAFSEFMSGVGPSDLDELEYDRYLSIVNGTEVSTVQKLHAVHDLLLQVREKVWIQKRIFKSFEKLMFQELV